MSTWTLFKKGKWNTQIQSNVNILTDVDNWKDTYVMIWTNVESFKYHPAEVNTLKHTYSKRYLS